MTTTPRLVLLLALTLAAPALAQSEKPPEDPRMKEVLEGREVAAPSLTQSTQSLEQVLKEPAVQKALTHVEGQKAAAARRLTRIGGITSPSGHEHQRAQAVAAEMRRIGLSDVTVDGTPNVVGRIRGTSGKALVFVSTLDDVAMVAEHQKAAGHPPVVQGDRVVGPGTRTSSMTVAMLAAAEALLASKLKPTHDVVFAAVAQEETGMAGMKKLYEQYRDRTLGVVDLIGDGSVIGYGAIALHWWKVVASGPAGHSLGGGLPNVNQGLARALDRILQLPHPQRHRDRWTFINVAMVQSGTVFNHKPDTGWFSLDIRSLDPAIVEAIEQEVRQVLEQVTKETGVGLKLELVHQVPGGQLPGARESALVTTSAAIARHLGLEPKLFDAGSSNMNVAIGGGTSAICLASEAGGKRGTPEEWADLPEMVRTSKHIVLLTAALGR